MSQGGHIWSLDMYYGLATGLYPETAGNNDLGNPVRIPSFGLILLIIVRVMHQTAVDSLIRV